MIRPALLLALAILASPAARAQEGLFPFTMPSDAPDNATNVSRWIERPAGGHGFVRAEGGRLATEAGPIRFWATNLCFDGCFPTHADAQRLAARLPRLGINCVRLHHMDMYSIWGKSPDKRTIDPDQLDRLDYLIDQFKRHGVYVDVNLHVSRTLGEREGFPAQDRRPQFDKGLDNFEPRMIELQKKYARDLLTHVNPYTKTAYTDEPSVAFVEINNENSLFSEWDWGSIDRLPEPYAATFRKAWNAWLRKKHGATEKLRAAWAAGSRPLGKEMLVGGDFAGSIDPGWQLERDGQTDVDWSALPGGPDGRRMLRIVVRRQGQVAWRPQINQGGLKIEKAMPYTLTCWARADAKRAIHVNCMMAHDPWDQLGFYTTMELEPKWKQQRFTFMIDRSDANARITLTGLIPGTYELAAVSLRPGGVLGLEPGQRIEGRFGRTAAPPQHAPDHRRPAGLHRLPLGHRARLLVGHVSLPQGRPEGPLACGGHSVGLEPGICPGRAGLLRRPCLLEPSGVPRPRMGRQQLVRPQYGDGEQSGRNARRSGRPAGGRQALHGERVQSSRADRVRGRRLPDDRRVPARSRAGTRSFRSPTRTTATSSRTM